MIFIIATYNADNEPLYFWGFDDLSLGYADYDITSIFKSTFISGIIPWPKFLHDECFIIATYPNINSSADAQHLLPELFL